MTASAQPAKAETSIRWLWIALAALWLPVCWRLHFVWSAGEDQAFGWAVPVLAVYLATERWHTRPRSLAPAGTAAITAWLAIIIGACGLAAAMPVWEASLLWPRLQWWSAGSAALATIGFVALAGGWRSARHFVFPIFFFTTALSWPTVVHLGVVSGLGGVNAWLAAEFASACGRPALATGNLIEVGTGFVGVDEACSGLRSLQAVWMVGWLFGEVFGLRWPRRVLLVLLALFTAFLGNVVRTIFLTWQAASSGTAAVDEWHDSAGITILLGTLVVVALLGWWFSRGRAVMPSAASIDSTWRWPRRAAVVLLGISAVGSIGTEAWYRWHERAADTGVMLWRLEAEGLPWRPVEVPERALELLGEPESEGLAWDGGGRTRALAYVFRWDRDVVRAGAAEMHDPTICLPAIGAVLDAELAEEHMAIEGRDLAFQVYRFDTVNGVQFVFFGLWDGSIGGMRPAVSGSGETLADFRFQLVREGRRRAELAHITFVTAGMADESMARDWLRLWAPRLLKPAR